MCKQRLNTAELLTQEYRPRLPRKSAPVQPTSIQLNTISLLITVCMRKGPFIATRLNSTCRRVELSCVELCRYKRALDTPAQIDLYFSRSIKSLIYNIFTYNVWTLNFYRKGP